MYDFEKIIREAGGAAYIKYLVEEEGYSYTELKKVLSLNTSSNVTCRKFIQYCDAVIPFPKANQSSRKWMIRWLKNGSSYWKDDYLVLQTLHKLNSPIINRASSNSSTRYRLTMWGHPSANKDSHQMAAHQVVWELDNECFLPEGYEAYPIDGNYTNLSFDNYTVRTTTSRKSFYASGERNHFYTGSPRYTNYTRGWGRLSKAYKDSVLNRCEICSSEHNMNTHHIISYWLFNDDDVRVHSEDNLLCVCDVCHGYIHQNNTQIVPHISVTKYNKLLELLGSLKSQVPESLMETYKDVEKQLGLTDNQQLST